MVKTVISKAKELLETEGKEIAINFFQVRIDEIGEPKNFQDICNISGSEVAIEWIKNNS